MCYQQQRSMRLVVCQFVITDKARSALTVHIYTTIVLTLSPIIRCLRPIIDTFRLGLCGLAVLSVEVR